MRFWKFLCSSATEAECFGRSLFGLSEKYREQVLQVRRGDKLLLYNMDWDVAFLPFTAESDGGWMLEEDAWGGRFPAQVRVSWKALTIINRASEKYPFLKDRRIELKKEEFESLLSHLIPRDLLGRIRGLDQEIHTLAHRLEEDLMERKRHPADRIINLDLHRAEMLSRMRDFVWTIRLIDKKTGLLDLPSSRKELF